MDIKHALEIAANHKRRRDSNEEIKKTEEAIILLADKHREFVGAAKFCCTLSGFGIRHNPAARNS